MVFYGTRVSLLAPEADEMRTEKNNTR